MEFRIDNHLQEFPNSFIGMKNGKLWGLWCEGNNYKRKVPFHGSYPPSYLRRVFSLLPEHKPTDLLHLFSGAVPENTGIRFDCSDTFSPDVVGNAEYISKYFPEDSFKFVLADPPYTSKDADIYGTKMPRSWMVFRELHEIVRPGGVVVWLCTKPPVRLGKQWREAGQIGYNVGTNRSVRFVIFLERI